MSTNYHKIVRFNHISRTITKDSQTQVQLLEYVAHLERLKDKLQSRRGYLQGVKLAALRSQICYAQQGYRRLQRCLDHKAKLIRSLEEDDDMDAVARQQEKFRTIKLQLYREAKYIKELTGKKTVLQERILALSERIGSLLIPICENTLKAGEIRRSIANMHVEKEDIMRLIAPMDDPCIMSVTP